MRTLIIMIFSLIFIKGIDAQKNPKNFLPMKDEKVIYTEVVQVDSILKAELYKRAKRWIANNNYIAKLDIADELVVTGNIQYKDGFDYWRIWPIIKIQIKNDRYKYEISDFDVREFTKLDEPSTFKKYSIDSPRYDKEFYDFIDASVKKLIESLKKAMKTTVDDNW